MRDSLADLRQFVRASTGDDAEEGVCHLFHCPRLKVLMEVLWETIEVLERTKGSFRSKTLADLRVKLEHMVELHLKR